MPSTVEMVLLTGVFGILFVSLILLLVLGAQTFTQFNELGTSLSNAYEAVLLTLEQVSNSILQSLQAFADTAVSVFKNAATSLGTSFANITSFLEDEFASTIGMVGSTTIRLVGQVTRSLTGGLVGSANAAVQLLQVLQTLLLQIAQLIGSAVVSAASFIFSMVSSAISFLLRLILGVIGCVINPILCGLNCVRLVFGYIFCGACIVCCIQPFTGCSLANLSGPSCCGVDGCGGCVGAQVNICNDPGAIYGTIPYINAPCLFGSFSCPSTCS
jgi:hypothetical protein